MATELKLRRGTTSQHSSFTGAEAEVTVDTDKNTVVVHDGSTAGGFTLYNQTTAISGDQIDGGAIDTTDLSAENLTGDVAAARITDALNATGTAPIYACRAWVNFDGTGTPTIRESGNVLSVNKNATGNYTVVIDTDMPDANYIGIASSNGEIDQTAVFAPGDGLFSILTKNSSFSLTDQSRINFLVIR